MPNLQRQGLGRLPGMQGEGVEVRRCLGQSAMQPLQGYWQGQVQLQVDRAHTGAKSASQVDVPLPPLV